LSEPSSFAAIYLACTHSFFNSPDVHAQFSHPILLLLCLASSIVLSAAEASAPPSNPTASETKATGQTATDPVLVLPKLEVRQQRIKQIDKELKRLDKMIAREKKKVKSTQLDRALNNNQVTRAAALFGGNSAEHLSAVAATRVALLENERIVLEAMKRPATLEERAMMEAEIEQLRITRRNLDDHSKQR
jgi:hypothetical protein